MKKILAVILCVFLPFCAGQTCLASAYVDAVADPETLNVSISGKIDGCSKDYVSLFVTKLAREEINTESINSGSVIFMTKRSGSDGSYSFSFKLPNGFKSGEYYVYVSGAEEYTQTRFTFYNKNLADSALSAINSADEKTMEIAISEHIEDFGLTIGEFESQRQYICDVVLKSRPKNGYDAESFIKAFKTGSAIGNIKDGKSALADELEKNRNYTGVDLSDYEALSRIIREDIETLFRLRDYDYTSFADFYETNLLLAEIRTAPDAESLKKFIIANAGKIGIDLSKYNEINNDYYQNNVFLGMYNDVKNAVSAEGVKALFDTQTDIQKSEYDKYISKNNPPSGGGGGGGTGGSLKDVSTVYPPVIQEPSSGNTVQKFSDTSGHWAEKEIGEFVEKGILTGYTDGTFRPDKNVTRAEFAVMLSRALELNPVYAGTFLDVSDNSWYCGYVNAAAKIGLINGYNGNFSPDILITREDMAVMTERAVRAFYSALSDGSFDFEDSSDISDYAKASVSRLASAGIISGYNNKFSPSDYTTRAQAVKILWNMISAFGV